MLKLSEEDQYLDLIVVFIVYLLFSLILLFITMSLMQRPRKTTTQFPRDV